MSFYRQAWHGSCSKEGDMYLREALIECRGLEDEIAGVYERLAAAHGSDRKLARLWQRMARDERLHARILSALLAAEEVAEDDGPFLVDLRQRIARARKLVDRTCRRIRSGISTEEAVELVKAIEESEINGLFCEVVELAKPALERLLAMVGKGGVLAHHERTLTRLRTRARHEHSEAGPTS
ncbi:MAG: hypothetical protein D6815_05655 [Candidatus Dadabacteria bacterium]|nr:MAG: hypothetical protein D6815_05655 [Candidatus Dadabacteria bacterium]